MNMTISAAKLTRIGQALAACASLSLGLPPTLSHAADAVLPKAKMCVYDPLGAKGDAFLAARDFRVEMLEHGVDIDLLPYVDERVAVEDFRTGQCDAVMATALRTKAFNDTAAALDAVGASSIVRNGKIDMEASYDVVRRFVQLMSTPKAANLMTDGAYEIAGIFPLGAAYVFVNDRANASIEGMSGKRIGAFDHDKAQAEMVQRMGARAVPADISNVGTMFNNRNVDMVVLPTIAYRPFELYRGLGTKGAVLRMPMTISTYQMAIRSAKFPKGLGQAGREYIAKNFDLAMATLKMADRDVAENFWMDATSADTIKFVDLARQVRIAMAEKGQYSKQGLKLVKRIRCTIAPEAGECTDASSENW